MGQPGYSELIKHPWEETFGQIRSSFRPARISDYRHRGAIRDGKDLGPVHRLDHLPALGPSGRGLRIGERALVRHESWGARHTILGLETRKWQCRECNRSFWQRFPGILPSKRTSESFRRSVFLKHWDGISRSRLGKREGIGSATVERWFQDLLQRKAAELSGASCPQGIDEHFLPTGPRLGRLPSGTIIDYH